MSMLVFGAVLVAGLGAYVVSTSLASLVRCRAMTRRTRLISRRSDRLY